MASPEFDFRFAPESGHSEAHAGLPLLTQSRHRELMLAHELTAIEVDGLTGDKGGIIGSKIADKV